MRALLPLPAPSLMLQILLMFLRHLPVFAMRGAWIFSREQSLAAAAAAAVNNNTVQWRGSARYGVWTVAALLCLGHVVSCLYVLFALLESNGDHVKFWLGQRRSKSKHLAAHYGRP
uniref:Uncharacterized protein n=1 Tax=Hyaloperonospora arabidopsidis (strain Emoy2) TaxID=559515 RepID=M4B5Y8_HYAAE